MEGRDGVSLRKDQVRKRVAHSVFVLVFQGGIAMMAGFLEPVLTTAAINEIICAGSLMILALGLNMLGITKIKVANYLPALIFAPIVLHLAALIPGL